MGNIYFYVIKNGNFFNSTNIIIGVENVKKVCSEYTIYVR